MKNSNININMFNLCQSNKIFQRLSINDETIKAIEYHINNNAKEMSKVVYLYRKDRYKKLFKKQPIDKLTLIYLYLPIIAEKYNKLGIEEDIFYDTFSDVKIWIDDYYMKSKQVGLQELNWLVNHMDIKLFKLGRLQFQLCRYSHPKPYKKGSKVLMFGDNIINLHIPRGERLDTALCRDSFQRADKFFIKFFPQYSTSIFMCDSWMLHSSNEEYMSKSSNIMEFSKLFDIIAKRESVEQTFKWVFNIEIKDKTAKRYKKKYKTYINQECLPANTSLQKALKAYIQTGGIVGTALGIYNR